MLIPIILIVIASIIVLVLLICFLIYLKAFYNEKKGTPLEWEPLKGERYTRFEERSRNLIKSSRAIPYEVKELKLNKHFTLRAKYYFQDKNAPLAIMVHGYKGNGIRDFSGGLVELLNRGSNVLLIDHRGHASSDGRTITFGVKEKYDVIKWINWANKEFNNPDIYLYGISMGGAIVLMVSGMKELPGNVKCVIADCPYSSVKEIIGHTVHQMHLPYAPTYPFIWLSALIYAHFNIKQGEVKKFLINTKIPVMIIHGNIDDIVPVESSRELKKEFSDKIHYVEIDNAPHGMSYFEAYDKYSEELTSFLNKIKSI